MIIGAVVGFSLSLFLYARGSDRLVGPNRQSLSQSFAAKQCVLKGASSDFALRGKPKRGKFWKRVLLCDQHFVSDTVANFRAARRPKRWEVLARVFLEMSVLKGAYSDFALRGKSQKKWKVLEESFVPNQRVLSDACSIFSRCAATEKVESFSESFVAS
jgi:hypothetical protein